MLIIPVQKNNINRALKTFKRKFKQTGTLRELRERQFFLKKSTKKKIKKNKTLLKHKYRNEDYG